MTILDRAATTQRIRIDATQLADELAKHMPDIDEVRDAAASAVHDAADRAGQSIDRAAEIARGLRIDIAHAVERAQADGRAEGPAASPAVSPADELGLRLRGASTNAIRVISAPGRPKLLVAGLVAVAAGVIAGVIAAVLLEPAHGKERRERIAQRTGGLTHGVGTKVGDAARTASDRARGIAIERGLLKPPAEPVEEGVAADAVPVGPGPLPVVDDVAVAPQLVGVAPTNGAGANGADPASDHGSTRSISG
jgi:hypothetical protein